MSLRAGNKLRTYTVHIHECSMHIKLYIDTQISDELKKKSTVALLRCHG